MKLLSERRDSNFYDMVVCVWPDVEVREARCCASGMRRLGSSNRMIRKKTQVLVLWGPDIGRDIAIK